MERRLAAILAADVAGYTALMGADEVGTLQRLTDLRQEVLEPLIAAHRGRIVKLMGDGFLVEFSSVVDALTCAVAWQKAIIEREALEVEDKQIKFRIGVNLGDVLVEDGDIHGDGVNIAARLESLAKPGGICISGDAYRQAKGKVEVLFEDLGEQWLKNVLEPVRVYQCLMDRSAARWPQRSNTRTKWFRPLAVAAGALALLVVVAGLALWQRPWALREQLASETNMAFPLPDRPSIAVLPFSNLSSDAGEDYVADGVTEDIINELSRFRDLFVIARTSSFAYKDKPVKVQQVAEELGVRYVLEGSVRRSPDRLRVTAQLVDALSGGQLWADSFDRKPSEILTLQENIIRNIVTMMAVKVDEAEFERIKNKAPANLDAYDYVLQADRTFNRYEKQENLKARALYEKAIEHDPEYARAYTGLAGTHERDFVFGWSESPTLSLTLGIESAQKAITLDPSDYKAHNELGWAFLFQRRHEEGMAELEKANALNPNDPDVLTDVGFALIYVGKPSEALETIKTAMRLNPFHPDWYWDALAFAYYYNREYEEAIKAAKRVPKPWAGIYRELAASYAQLDRMAEAQAAAAKVLELEPDFSTEIFKSSMPFKEPNDIDHYLRALHKAGLPE